MTDAAARRADQDQKNRRMVLAMFTETCPVPTRADIEAWCDDHPRHAEAIRELAADLLIDEELGHDAPEPTPAELDADRRMVADMAARITGRRPSSMTISDGKKVPLCAPMSGHGQDASPKWFAPASPRWTYTCENNHDMGRRLKPGFCRY